MRRKISVLLVLALIATMMASYFTVDASSSVTGVTISTTKTAFASGEDIVVDISGYTTELQGVDMEFRLEKGIVQEWHGYDNRSSYGYLAYLDIGKDAKDENANSIATPTSTHRVTFKAGMRVHPEAVASGTVSSIPDGFYTLWVLGFTNGYRQELSNRIYITVGDNLPSLSLSKDVYEVGENIVATYANFTEAYYGAHFTEIDIFAEGGIPGQPSTPSKAGYVIKNSTISGISASGTISFPEADTDRNQVNFPLPAGNYYMCLRKDNSVVGIPVKFSIVDELPSGSPSGSPSTEPSPSPSANPYPVEISVEKTEFTEGEDIVISYEGLLESLYTKADGSWHDVEMRLVKGHDLTDTQYTEYALRYDYSDLTGLYSANSYQAANNTYASVTESGTRSFHKEGYLGTEVVPGEYTIVVYDYSATGGAKQVSNVLEITVVAAQTPNQPTGDSSLFVAAAMMVVCAGACVVFFRKRCSE